MNSIILIAACVVCLDQLAFPGAARIIRRRQPEGPREKSRRAQGLEPHTPKAVPAPRRSPEILIVPS